MPPPRRPGQHQRGIVRRYALRLLIALVVIVLVAIAVSVTAGFHSTAFVIAELVAITMMVGIDRIGMPIIDRRDRGAAGEEGVGAILDSMASEGWLAIHDIANERGNIDHVVVGPGGIFTIETKSHRGRINAHRVVRWMLKQAYAEAKLIERLAGMRAEPLLVFSNAYLTPAVTRREGVVILPGRMLAGHLRRRRTMLGPAEVATLYEKLLGALSLATETT